MRHAGPLARRAVRGALVLVALAALGCAPARAADAAPPAAPSLVRVTLDAAHPLRLVLEGGFDLAESRAGRADVVAWPGDVERLGALGFTVEVLDPDPAATVARRAAAERPARSGAARATTGAPPLGSGSLGGHWTLDEVKQKLDAYVANDVDGVVADTLDTLGLTWENRPIWGLRLGRAAAAPAGTPVVFYTGLTHAREPGGMEALLDFVDDLLAGYASDPWKHYLLDHRVLVIVPVLNPDGYVYNQTTNPGGGGLWRKNRRPGSGVDLNRNYGFAWGYDNAGSSPTASSEVYRGPAAFSEPETRAHRDYIDRLRPRASLSFHTYGDYTLFPWGYANAAVPDRDAYREWSDAFTRPDGYLSGSVDPTLYAANGALDDWCYGDTLLKPRTFAWTSEVGVTADGFWAPPSRIVPLARENRASCYALAALAGAWPRADRLVFDEGELDAGRLSTLRLRARDLGLDPTPAGLTATLTPLDAGVSVLSGPVAYPAMAARQSAWAVGGAGFLVTAADSVTPGRRVRFLVEFGAADGTYARDTLETLVGNPTLVVSDPLAPGFAGWSASAGWTVLAGTADHPGYAYNGRSATTASMPLTRRAGLDLSAGVHAWLSYGARWVLPNDRLGVVVEASTDSVNWTQLAGGAMVPALPGSGLPSYDGTRWLWRTELVDLSAYAGPGAPPVKVRFRALADNPLGLEGFSLDSVRVMVYDPHAQPVPLAIPIAVAPSAPQLAAPWPNPARALARLAFDLPAEGAVTLEVLDVQGRHVRTLARDTFAAGPHLTGWDLRDDRGARAPAGLYLVRLSGAGTRLVRRVLVLP